MPARSTLPSYRLHKASGQAIVTLSGKDFYLGPHGTKLSRDAYDRVVGEWLAAARTVPLNRNDGFQVEDLVDRYVAAKAKCLPRYKSPLKLLLRLYGTTDAAAFGPLALESIQKRWADEALRRTTISEYVNFLRRVFRWGVAKQWIAPSVADALDALEHLAAGESSALESVERQAVELDRVEALLAAAPPMLAAMIRVQLLAGMRGGELCAMRPCDLDTSGYVWIYTPPTHKTQHLGKIRQIAIGPQAMEVLRPWLPTDVQANVFSPARAEADRREKQHAARTTPLSCGNRPQPARRRRAFSTSYTSENYRQAIERLLIKLNPPPGELARLKGETDTTQRKRLGAEKWNEVLEWRRRHRWTPHQLRHAFGESVREDPRFGLDFAQVALGHSNANVTEIYAKVNFKKAAEVAAAIG